MTLEHAVSRPGFYSVNAIAPGYIDTERVSALPSHIVRNIVAAIPAECLGEHDEVSRIVAFIARDDSGFITGATFSVNGGQWSG